MTQSSGYLCRDNEIAFCNFIRGCYQERQYYGGTRFALREYDTHRVCVCACLRVSSYICLQYIAGCVLVILLMMKLNVGIHSSVYRYMVYGVKKRWRNNFGEGNNINFFATCSLKVQNDDWGGGGREKGDISQPV